MCDLAFGGRALTRAKFAIFVMWVLGCFAFATSVLAQDDVPANNAILLLLSSSPGAPTPDEIINYYAHPIGPPPLRALISAVPTGAEYLLPNRAEGDFLEQLQAHPDSPRAQLERYIILNFPDNIDISLVVTALRLDPFVAAAYEDIAIPFASAGVTNFTVDSSDGDGQYGRTDLNIDEAWQIEGGYALVAVIDSGLWTGQTAFQQFSAAGQYLGGNLIPADSQDIGGTGVPGGPPNRPSVDELNTAFVSDPVCTSTPQQMAPTLAGHGTHVSGLLAANGASIGVLGTCQHCGEAMQKVTYAGCNDLLHAVVPVTNGAAQVQALTNAADFGAQVVNMSFAAFSGDVDPCRTQPADYPLCAPIKYAMSHDIAMVASSGNDDTNLYFPAKDTRLIPAGGFQQDLLRWNLAPNCPPGLGGDECGSNYTYTPNFPKQELMGSAQSVWSTTYPDYNWAPATACGDQFPGPGWGNGVGWCTGTSMSAPQIAGVVGILRSINPLVPVGTPPTAPASDLRYVLASTTFEAQAGHGWDPQVGYGHPDAALAANTMLGHVAGVFVKNRATPLFRLYSSGNSDYADTTSPQLAVSLMLAQKNSWQPSSTIALVPNYSTFPHDSTDGTLAAPRAAVYVMTTQNKPRSEWPALLPLYLMNKNYGSTGIDYMLATTTAEVTQAHTTGYSLFTIQGYIYQPCTPEPNCIPPGAQKFWREFKASINDCATFLESERTIFESNGYNAACPAGSTKMIGYAYPATDTDGDGLPDGFEYVVGTSPTRADSDGDGIPDGQEFPMIGVAVSDACKGGTGALYCGADSIFRNGFDPL